MHLKLNKKIVLQTTISLVAILITSLAINLLAWQFKLISGGLTGYALLANNFINISLGTLTFMANIVIILISFFTIGKVPGAKAFIGFIFLSISVDVSRTLLNLQQVPIDNFALNVLIILLLSIIMSTVVCVVLANEFSLGAYSTIYLIIKKYVKLTPQATFLILDILLSILVALVSDLKVGLIVLINATSSYFVVKLLYPRIEKWFARLYLTFKI